MCLATIKHWLLHNNCKCTYKYVLTQFQVNSRDSCALVKLTTITCHNLLTRGDIDSSVNVIHILYVQTPKSQSSMQINPNTLPIMFHYTSTVKMHIFFFLWNFCGYSHSHLEKKILTQIQKCRSGQNHHDPTNLNGRYKYYFNYIYFK